MSAAVKLSQKQTVQWYLHVRSCERATFALEPDLLAEFENYYDEEKVLKIQNFIAELRQWAATSRRHPLFLTAYLRPFVSMLSRVPLDAYYFEPEMLLRSKAALEQFINLKACSCVSDQKIHLQEELAFLRDRIEKQSGVLRWHRAANEVDHFYRSLTLPAFTIEELLETESSVLYERWNGAHGKRVRHIMDLPHDA